MGPSLACCLYAHISKGKHIPQYNAGADPGGGSR